MAFTDNNICLQNWLTYNQLQYSSTVCIWGAKTSLATWQHCVLSKMLTTQKYYPLWLCLQGMTLPLKHQGERFKSTPVHTGISARSLCLKLSDKKKTKKIPFHVINIYLFIFFLYAAWPGHNALTHLCTDKYKHLPFAKMWYHHS